MTTKLSDLNLPLFVLHELNIRGYETAEELRNIPCAELLTIPNLGGIVWRRICKAAGRERFNP
jgi:DNA-directed RNA polymerase alpha subunit